MLMKIFVAASLVADAATVLAAGLWGGWGGVLKALGLFLLYYLACMALWVAFIFLLSWCTDMKKPAGKHWRAWRAVVERTLELLLWVLRVRIHATGVEKVPKEGRFLFTCNHIANYDPMVALVTLQNYDLTFISKKENFNRFMVGRLMHGAGMLSLDRENDRSAVRTILEAIRLLKTDETSIAIYPEGYCRRDAETVLQPFRDGSLKIAQKAGVPVVVATVRDTDTIERNFFRKLHTDVYFDILTVFTAEELTGLSTHEVGEKIWPVMYEHLKQGNG